MKYINVEYGFGTYITIQVTKEICKAWGGRLSYRKLEKTVEEFYIKHGAKSLRESISLGGGLIVDLSKCLAPHHSKDSEEIKKIIVGICIRVITAVNLENKKGEDEKESGRTLEEQILILKEHRTLLELKIHSQQSDLDGRLCRMQSLEKNLKKVMDISEKDRTENYRLKKYEILIRKYAKKFFLKEKRYLKSGELKEIDPPSKSRITEEFLDSLMDDMKRLLLEG